MKKKYFSLCTLFLHILFISGCETAASLGKGLTGGVGAVAEGISKDAKAAYNFLQEADDWVKKNLW